MVQLFVVHGRRFALAEFAAGDRAELPASDYPASSFSALLSDVLQLTTDHQFYAPDRSSIYCQRQLANGLWF
jgi:hypothetical protein